MANRKNMAKFTVKNGVGIIPPGTKKIPAYAFEDCDDLKSIRIPASVEEIGIGIFKGCSNLEEIIVSSQNKVFESNDRAPDLPKNCNAIIRKLDNMLICGCKNTVIPQYVTVIEGEAFWDCGNLTEMYFKYPVMGIYDEAFRECPDLQCVEFAGDVMKITGGAFYHCPCLSKVIFSGDVMEIEPNAFDTCTNLTRIDFYGEVMTIANNAFHGYSPYFEIVVPDGKANLYKKLLPSEYQERVFERK